MSRIKFSEIQSGEVVTTINRLDGVGLGHLVDGVVWVSTGNGFAVPAEDDVFGLVSFERDGGAGYRAEVRRVVGW